MARNEQFLIDLSTIETECENFTKCKKQYENVTFSSFNNSYLTKCTNSQIRSAVNKIKRYYQTVQKDYEGICKWWQSYLDNVKGLENYLSGNGISTLTEPSLINFLKSSIKELESYDFDIQILYSTINQNLKTYNTQNGNVSKFGSNSFGSNNYNSDVKEATFEDIFGGSGQNKFAKFNYSNLFDSSIDKSKLSNLSGSIQINNSSNVGRENNYKVQKSTIPLAGGMAFGFGMGFLGNSQNSFNTNSNNKTNYGSGNSSNNNSGLTKGNFNNAIGNGHNKSSNSNFKKSLKDMNDAINNAGSYVGLMGIQNAENTNSNFSFDVLDNIQNKLLGLIKSVSTGSVVVCSRNSTNYYSDIITNKQFDTKSTIRNASSNDVVNVLEYSQANSYNSRLALGSVIGPINAKINGFVASTVVKGIDKTKTFYNDAKVKVTETVNNISNTVSNAINNFKDNRATKVEIDAFVNEAYEKIVSAIDFIKEEDINFYSNLSVVKNAKKTFAPIWDNFNSIMSKNNDKKYIEENKHVNYGDSFVWVGGNLEINQKYYQELENYNQVIDNYYLLYDALSNLSMELSEINMLINENEYRNFNSNLSEKQQNDIKNYINTIVSNLMSTENLTAGESELLENIIAISSKIQDNNLTKEDVELLSNIIGQLGNKKNYTKDIIYKLEIDREKLPYKYMSEMEDFDELSDFSYLYDKYKTNVDGEIVKSATISYNEDTQTYTINGIEYIDKWDYTGDEKTFSSIDQLALFHAIATKKLSFEGNDYENTTIPLFHEYYNNGYQYLTENEIKIYHYIYQKYGASHANDYLDSMRDTLNERQGLKEALDYFNNLEGNNNIEKFLQLHASGINNGIGQFFQGIDNVIFADGILSSDTYKQMWLLQILSGQVDLDSLSEENKIFVENLIKEYESTGASFSFSYNTGVTIGNMIPSTVVSAVISPFFASEAVAAGVGAAAVETGGSVVPQIVSSSLIGLSTYGNTKNQALHDGASKMSASMQGLLSGLSEGGLEFLLGNIPGISKESSNTLLGFLKEGGEECIQQFTDMCIRMSNGEYISVDQLTKEEFETFIMSVIVSAEMNGASTMISNGAGMVTLTAENIMNSYNKNGVDGVKNYINEQQTNINLDNAISENIKLEEINENSQTIVDNLNDINIEEINENLSSTVDNLDSIEVDEGRNANENIKMQTEKVTEILNEYNELQKSKIEIEKKLSDKHAETKYDVTNLKQQLDSINQQLCNEVVKIKEDIFKNNFSLPYEYACQDFSLNSLLPFILDNKSEFSNYFSKQELVYIQQMYDLIYINPYSVSQGYQKDHSKFNFNDIQEFYAEQLKQQTTIDLDSYNNLQNLTREQVIDLIIKLQTAYSAFNEYNNKVNDFEMRQARGEKGFYQPPSYDEYLANLNKYKDLQMNVEYRNQINEDIKKYENNLNNTNIDIDSNNSNINAKIENMNSQIVEELEEINLPSNLEQTYTNDGKVKFGTKLAAYSELISSVGILSASLSNVFLLPSGVVLTLDGALRLSKILNNMNYGSNYSVFKANTNGWIGMFPSSLKQVLDGFDLVKTHEANAVFLQQLANTFTQLPKYDSNGDVKIYNGKSHAGTMRQLKNMQKMGFIENLKITEAKSRVLAPEKILLGNIKGAIKDIKTVNKTKMYNFEFNLTDKKFTIDEAYNLLDKNYSGQFEIITDKKGEKYVKFKSLENLDNVKVEEIGGIKKGNTSNANQTQDLINKYKTKIFGFIDDKITLVKTNISIVKDNFNRNYKLWKQKIRLNQLEKIINMDDYNPNKYTEHYEIEKEYFKLKNAIEMKLIDENTYLKNELNKLLELQKNDLNNVELNEQIKDLENKIKTIESKKQKMEYLAKDTIDNLSKKEYELEGLSEEIQIAANQYAEQMLNELRLKEEQITVDLREFENWVTALIGEDNRFKEEDSLSRKIIDKALKFSKKQPSELTVEDIFESSSQIGDGLRYTFLIGSNKFTTSFSYQLSVDHILDTLTDKGYEVISFENNWSKPHYKGINVSIKSPTGVVFELQFHTPESYRTKEGLTHKFYEIKRNQAIKDETITTLADEIQIEYQNMVPIPQEIIDYKWEYPIEKYYAKMEKLYTDLEYTMPLISISKLLSILDEDNILNKFDNFDNNEEIFGEFSKKEYIESLNHLKIEINENFQISAERLEVLNNILEANPIVEQIEEINENNNSIVYENNLFSNMTEGEKIQYFKDNYGIDFNQNQQKLTNLKKEIIDNMPKKLNNIEKARYVYLELGKRVDYSDSYYFSTKNGNTDKNIYYKNIDINEADLSDIVCITWSKLYRDLLIEAGINPKKIKLEGNSSKLGSHVWVSISLGLNFKILADAAQPTGIVPDFSKIKNGLRTDGFIIYSGKNAKVGFNDFEIANPKNKKDASYKKNLQDILKKYEKLLMSVDKKLGYIDGKYYDEKLHDITENFNDINLEEEIFNDSYNIDIYHLYELISPNRTVISAYGTIKALMNNTYGKNSNFEYKIDGPFIYKKSENMYGFFTISIIRKSDGQKINYIYTTKNGLVTINDLDLENLINDLKLIN